MLHNERGLLADQFDLSHLKMRHRDELIDTFKSWFQKVRFDGELFGLLNPELEASPTTHMPTSCSGQAS